MTTYSNPAYMNPAGTQIDITRPDGVRTTITPNDPSSALWGQVIAGAYGPPTPYIARPASAAELSAYANRKLSLLLAVARSYSSSGGTISADATTPTRADLQSRKLCRCSGAPPPT